MLKNLIVLPDGTELYSGVGKTNNIRSTTVTQCVNSGTELTLGSTCAAMLECTIQAPNGGLSIAAGTEITLYKVDGDSIRHKVGLFTLEEPTQSSAHIYKITAYDRVSWLDRDLTDWLSNLDGWPYSLLTFAQMVCEECLLTLATTDIPNADFPVNKFPASKITGRKIMEWIGQLAGRFCRANADGEIEFAWYTPSGVTLTSGGERYMFSLKYDSYQVAKIDTVQLRLADSEYGTLWPEAAEGANAYVISGNYLITEITNDLKPYLQVIQQEVGDLTYTPCTVTVPACLDIRAGQTVKVTDVKGNTITTIVMTKTQKGQKDTIESTGSYRRDSPTAVNNQKASDSELEQYADSAAMAAVNNQTQEDIFNKLTNNGAIKGVFIGEDGEMYINASYIVSGILNADLIKSGTLNADLIKAGILQSEDGESFILDLINNTFSMRGTGRFTSPDGKSYITIEGDVFVLYAQDGESEEFKPIARIGFTEDSEGYDYPYILLGNSTDSGENGLIKKFGDGLFIGNSESLYADGKFVPGAESNGFFINTTTGKAYAVRGGDMLDVFARVEGSVAMTTSEISHVGDVLFDVMPVYLTQEEYNALEASGGMNDNTPYFIRREV